MLAIAKCMCQKRILFVFSSVIQTVSGCCLTRRPCNRNMRSNFNFNSGSFCTEHKNININNQYRYQNSRYVCMCIHSYVHVSVHITEQHFDCEYQWGRGEIVRGWCACCVSPTHTLATTPVCLRVHLNTYPFFLRRRLLISVRWEQRGRFRENWSRHPLRESCRVC